MAFYSMKLFDSKQHRTRKLIKTWGERQAPFREADRWMIKLEWEEAEAGNMNTMWEQTASLYKQKPLITRGMHWPKR